jgi:hypothetical protein
MATDPSFAATPARVSTAYGTAEAGFRSSVAGTAPTNSATLVTAPATGTKITEVIMQAGVTTTAGMIRLHVVTSGVWRMIDEIPVVAVTPSATVPAWRAVRTYKNLTLKTGQLLSVTVEKSEAFLFHIEAADL